MGWDDILLAQVLDAGREVLMVSQKTLNFRFPNISTQSFHNLASDFSCLFKLTVPTASAAYCFSCWGSRA
jgi:hypothetical protein